MNNTKISRRSFLVAAGIAGAAAALTACGSSASSTASSVAGSAAASSEATGRSMELIVFAAASSPRPSPPSARSTLPRTPA